MLGDNMRWPINIHHLREQYSQSLHAMGTGVNSGGVAQLRFSAGARNQKGNFNKVQNKKTRFLKPSVYQVNI